MDNLSQSDNGINVPLGGSVFMLHCHSQIEDMDKQLYLIKPW